MKTNMELCIDLKTMLQNDVLMKPGKNYPGILRREIPSEEFGFDDGRYSFVETLHSTAGKRNPRVFDGQYISITRQDNGALRLNFKQMPKIDTNLSFERYTFGVYLELHKGLKGLIEK